MNKESTQKGWKETTLGKISSNIAYGYTESSSSEKIGPKFLRITDIQNDFIDWNKVPYCPISEENHKKYALEVGDVVIARTGNSTGATATIKKDTDAVFASYLIRFKIDPQKADYNYVDFLLRSNQWKSFVKSIKTGSAQGGANAKQFAGFPIVLPPLPEQRAIAAVLSSFDDKIELLRSQNQTLEALAQALFREWFVDFNFPNAQGKPYKKSGGKMVESELGEIPEGWRVGKVKEIVEIFDSQRIPLASNEREKRKGIYPYYGATTIMDYVNDYLFDGIFLLFAEDGSVINDEGCPVLQYVWGKIWVNNHAHILQGKNGFSTEMLYLFFRKKKIAGIINGAVQLKINQANLLNLDIVIPKMEILLKFNEFIQALFEKIRNNANQIQNLSALRNTLLPRLMRGNLISHI